MNFDLRTVLFVEKLFAQEEYDKVFEAINYPVQPTVKDLELLAKLLSGSRFTASFKGDLQTKYENGDITKEDYEALNMIDTTFDIHADFDLVYGAFIHYYGIDLIDTDINYFKFQMLFEYILLDSENPIINRMKIRAFVPLQGNDESTIKYNANRLALKDKYSLS